MLPSMETLWSDSEFQKALKQGHEYAHLEPVPQSLKSVSIVLILNKLDVFRQQIQEHPLRTWFPDYIGGEKDHEAALSYIVAKFKATKSLYDEREMHIYYTDATNIDACQVTLKGMEENVISSKRHTD
ncbi:MAG: hypothetical protein Q9169_004456 [Polycauliona sp. 2 TL-2023]